MKRFLMIAAIAATAMTARAQTVPNLATHQAYYWDIDGTWDGNVNRQRTGGSGTWNNTDYVWRKGSTDSGGVPAPADYVYFSNRCAIETGHEDTATFGGAGSTGDGGTVTIQPEGIVVQGITFDKPYTFTGGPLMMANWRGGDGNWALNFNSQGGATGRVDTVVKAPGIAPPGAGTINFNGGPFIFTKPMIASAISFNAGVGFFCLSGKEVDLGTAPLSFYNAGAALCSEEALNAARVLENPLPSGVRIRTAGETDRFRFTGDIGGSLYGRSHLVEMEGAFTASSTTLDAWDGRVHLNGHAMAGTGQTLSLYGGTTVLGANDTLGDADILMNSATLVWAPGVTTDISGRIAPSSAGMKFDVGKNAILFTNAYTASGGIVLKGKASGSLTLKPAAPIAHLQGQTLNLYGGTLVLDFADIPLDGNNMAVNMIGQPSTLTPYGGTLCVIGKPTGVSSQTVNIVNFGMYTYIETRVESGGGGGTTLNLGGFNRNALSSMEITLADANARLLVPAYYDHPWPYTILRTPDGRWHFAYFYGSGEGLAMAYPTYTTLTPTAWGGRIYQWAGDVTMQEVLYDQPAAGSFKADATEADCVLDLNGIQIKIAALLTEGDYNVTVKNGPLHANGANTGWMFWVCGKGSLTLEDDVVVMENEALIKNGSGLLRIMGPLNTDKAFVINKGAVEIGHNDSLGALPASRSLNGEIRIQGDVTLIAGADDVEVKRNLFFDCERTLTVNVSTNKTLTLSGEISNAYMEEFNELRKVGDGTLVFTGTAAAFAGTIALEKGTLSVSALRTLGHPEFSAKHFGGGMLQITGTECGTIDTVYVDNWGSFDGGFDIAEAGHVFTVGSPVTVKAGGAFVTAGAGTLALEGGITLGAGTTFRVIGDIEGNGGVAVDDLDLSQATLEVKVADKNVTEVTIATVAGSYAAPASVTLPGGFALKYRNGKLTAQRSGGTLLLVR